MPQDHRYETALKFALAILHTVDRQGMTRQAKLASVTYAVLDAIYEADGPEPTASLPGLDASAGRVPTLVPTRLEGGRHERFKLPAAR